MQSTTSSPGSEPSPTSPVEALCSALAYRFSDDELLTLALRHRSWCSENGGVESNERLEFLGDAVLGLVITDHLFRSAPGLSEGVLARHRSELVSAVALADVARDVDLGAALSLGKGEETTGGRGKVSILADAMEAVIGAVYLDGGMGATTSLVLHLLDGRIADALSGALESDHKSRLQEMAAHRFGELPRYVLSEDGPEHQKRFFAKVELDGTVWGAGEGRTKKEAEQAAAQGAVVQLQRCDNDGPDVDPARVESESGAETTNEPRGGAHGRATGD